MHCLVEVIVGDISINKCSLQENIVMEIRTAACYALIKDKKRTNWKARNLIIDNFNQMEKLTDIAYNIVQYL